MKMSEIHFDEQVDITDVVCPVTFVKAKVALEEMDEGQVLAVKMNDGEPVQNVPRSIKEEGHQILKLNTNDFPGRTDAYKLIRRITWKEDNKEFSNTSTIDQLVTLKVNPKAEEAHKHKLKKIEAQQQRVAIARAIVNEPEVLLLDEPLAALDLKMRKDMQMELKEMHKSLGITFVYVTHDQEEALTLSDTIVVMSEGKIQQIGTPIDIYNEPINAFVADFIGESNILNGTMIHDKLVRFCGTEFECVDEGFGENVPVDVVIRPEDLYIFPVSEMAQLVGVVETSIFKGVHYEMTVLCGGYEFLVQDYHHFEVGAEVGLLVKPFDIHIMKKERVCNTFEGKLLDATHVEFLGCNFECVPVEGIAFDTNVKVEVDFEKVILQDNEEDGTLTGEVKFILYKGDHYHLTVLSDWDEIYSFYVTQLLFLQKTIALWKKKRRKNGQ